MTTPTDSHQLTLLLIEGLLTAIAFALPFAWPRLGSAWLSRIEQTFSRLAKRKGLSVAAVGIGTLVLRLAILPFSPVPLPFVPDDFSFLLAADTFAHGKLANPTPAMWTRFESIHITMQPTYASMYFPAQGLVLAAAKVLTGNPWVGVLCLSALMCAAICWMLQAWLPPNWALLGGIIAMLRLGLFSYWVNTYSGGGAIAALGGALVLGALPRLIKTAKFRYALLLAIGIILLSTSRPYEGLLLCIPVAVALGHWIFFGKNRPSPIVLIRRAAVPLALIVAAIAWLGYYDYRAFNNPFTLPYTVDRNTYARAPYYVWQPARPEIAYRHDVLRRFYDENELKAWESIHSRSGFLTQSSIKLARGFLFFAGIALLPPLIMLRRIFLDRRIRFLVVCTLVLTAGMLIEIFMIPHYLAPFTAAFYAIGLQAMRHLRVWKPGGASVGLTMVRLIVTLCVGLAGLRLFTQPLHLVIPEWPASDWSGLWYGPEHFGTARAQVANRLDQLPGKQLAIVRYTSDHNPLDEWVYNDADIDASKVVWAREMNTADNQELLHYYKDRQVWLIQPDAEPAAQQSPFASGQSAASTR